MTMLKRLPINSNVRLHHHCSLSQSGALGSPWRRPLYQDSQLQDYQGILEQNVLLGVRKLVAGHWSFTRKWPKINSKRHIIIETIPFISKAMILITSYWTSKLCGFLTVVVQCVAVCKHTLKRFAGWFAVKLLYNFHLLFMPNLSVTTELCC